MGKGGRGLRLRWIKHRRNKDGSLRVYVCPPGRKCTRMPNLPENHPEFLDAYQKAVTEAPRTGRGQPRKGTLEAVAESYRQSAAWRALAPSSKQQRDREITRLLDKAGGLQVTAIQPRHIRTDLSRSSPGAGSNRLKAWRSLMKHAVDSGVIEHDPSKDVSPPRQAKDGHHCWTREEIDAFRARWPIGSDQRLAFELAYWTGARRSDLVKLGWQLVRDDGWLGFAQQKTGGQVEIPLRELPTGCAALSHDHDLVWQALKSATGRMLFLETRQGAQRSHKAFGAWFGHACKAAGLPNHCTLHGLRKARAVALAELGWSTHRIGAWTGHTSLNEIAHYTRAANRKRLIAGTNGDRAMGT